MATIEFKVQGQELIQMNYLKLVEDSRNYLYCHFNFLDDEMEGHSKTAVFTHGEEAYPILLDETNTCAVPGQVLHVPGFEVSVAIGDFVPTNTVLVQLNQSGCIMGVYPPMVEEDLFTQMIGQFDEKMEIAQTAAATATAAAERTVANAERTDQNMANCYGVSGYVEDLERSCMNIYANVQMSETRCGRIEERLKALELTIEGYVQRAEAAAEACERIKQELSSEE